MLYHFEVTHDVFVGGSLGVDIFFVLSGFLITTLLLEERTRSGAVSFLHFYRRRARRLLPALFLFLAVFALVTLVTSQPGADKLPVTLGTAVFYVFNWLDDFGGTSTGGAGHLWSLSVEEQFYLVWPVAFVLATQAGPRFLLWFSVAAFVLSASLPAWSGRGYGEMYSGTDFRAQELMAGAILAQLRARDVVTPSIVRRWWFHTVLTLSVAFFAMMVINLENRREFLYGGMYSVVAVAAAVLVCAALYAPSRLLTNPVMRYVGTRSYALYLWHHVVNFWLRDVDPAPQLILSFVLSFAAAELSWRLVESRESIAFQLARRVRPPRALIPASGPVPASVSTPPAS
jgi:peptidoglycan/LPS O-acetylase OafA/YrhL